MPTVAVFDMTGKKTGEMELNAAVFGIEPNMTVVHAAVKNYLANQRQGTQSTLTRAEVRGGGIKPWFARTPASVRVPTPPRTVTTSLAAAPSPTVRRAPAVLVRVLSALRSGPMVVLPSARSPVPTTTA